MARRVAAPRGVRRSARRISYAFRGPRPASRDVARRESRFRVAPRPRSHRATGTASDLGRLLLGGRRGVDRGDLRRDVQRQERRAHSPRASRDHRARRKSRCSSRTSTSGTPASTTSRATTAAPSRRCRSTRPSRSRRLVLPDTQVVAIDEAQFLDASIVELVTALANRGTRVILAGTDNDFRGEPFGPMPQLLAVAGDRRQAARHLRDLRQSREPQPAPHRRPAGALRLADHHGGQHRVVRGSVPRVPFRAASRRGSGPTALGSRDQPFHARVGERQELLARPLIGPEQTRGPRW